MWSTGRKALSSRTLQLSFSPVKEGERLAFREVLKVKQEACSYKTRVNMTPKFHQQSLLQGFLQGLCMRISFFSLLRSCCDCRQEVMYLTAAGKGSASCATGKWRVTRASENDYMDDQLGYFELKGELIVEIDPKMRGNDRLFHLFRLFLLGCFCDQDVSNKWYYWLHTIDTQNLDDHCPSCFNPLW